MAVYNNKEEPGRRKKVSSAYKTAGTAAKEAASKALNTPMMAPVRAAASGYRETGQMLKQGLNEAAAQPSAAARTGAALRTLVTAPVAFAVGAGESVAEDTSPILKGAQEFGRSFVGSPANDTASPDSSTSPSRRQIGAGTPSAVQASGAAPQQQRPGKRIKFGEQGQPGTGIITTPTGAVKYSPDGGIVRVGDPSASIDTSPAARVTTPANQGKDAEGYYLYNGEKVPVRRQTGRMVLEDDNFNRPDPRPVEETVDPVRRVEDIPEPKTIGEVPVYRRRVEALQSDIAADQQRKQRDQQQQQFKDRQRQQQEQFGITTALNAQQAAQQGQQARARTALEERRLAGDQQRQQAELDLKQSQEKLRQEQQSRINEAIGAFSGAKTPQERRKAADMINILSGKGLKSEKSAAPAWKPKDVSDAVGAFEERFRADTEAGLIEEGASLQRTMFARDPGLYKAAYGNLSPQAAEFGERLLTMPLDKLKADEKFKALLEAAGEDVTAEELQAQLIADYYALSQGG